MSRGQFGKISVKNYLNLVFPKAEHKSRVWNKQFIWEVIPGNKSRGKARMNQRREKPPKGTLLKWS